MELNPSPSFVSFHLRVGRKRKKVNKAYMSLHKGSKTKGNKQTTDIICNFSFHLSHHKTHLLTKTRAEFTFCYSFPWLNKLLFQILQKPDPVVCMHLSLHTFLKKYSPNSTLSSMPIPIPADSHLPTVWPHLTSLVSYYRSNWLVGKQCWGARGSAGCPALCNFQRSLCLLLPKAIYSKVCPIFICQEFREQGHVCLRENDMIGATTLMLGQSSWFVPAEPFLTTSSKTLPTTTTLFLQEYFLWVIVV